MSEMEPTLTDIARDTMVLRQKHRGEMLAQGLQAFKQLEREQPELTAAANEIFPTRDEAALWLVTPGPKNTPTPLQQILSGEGQLVKNKLSFTKALLTMGA